MAALFNLLWTNAAILTGGGFLLLFHLHFLMPPHTSTPKKLMAA
jgi:hypothetical protein